MSRIVTPGTDIQTLYASAALGALDDGTPTLEGKLGGEVLREVILRMTPGASGQTTTVIPESFSLSMRHGFLAADDIVDEGEYSVVVQDTGGAGWPTLVAIAAELP